MFYNPTFYYVTIALQVICVLHCIRRGNQRWIWIIVFLPLVGCIVYFFTEMFTGRHLQKVQSGIGETINPSGSIRKLERALLFVDTFANRVALADAYLEAGFTDKAIELYESSRTGVFAENEHILLQLISAYYKKERYKELISCAQKIYNLPRFSRSKAHILYAKALEKEGRFAEAEKEFRLQQGKYSQFEARYEFGQFLVRQQREEEARHLFLEMVSEAAHLSAREKRYCRPWLVKTKEELKKMQVVG